MESAGDVLVIVMCNVIFTANIMVEKKRFWRRQSVLVSAGEVLVIVLCDVLWPVGNTAF